MNFVRLQNDDDNNNNVDFDAMLITVAGFVVTQASFTFWTEWRDVDAYLLPPNLVGALTVLIGLPARAAVQL